MELMAIRLTDQRTYSHCDAKLRGLGASTRLAEDQYLLLTGKSIKNIHIWLFVPSAGEPLWQCLYDCPTNGNTIQWLHFRRDPHFQLQAISKSQGQKLRIWDLSHETSSFSSHPPSLHRPTRPVSLAIGPSAAATPFTTKCPLWRSIQSSPRIPTTTRNSPCRSSTIRHSAGPSVAT
jgi:hypothetical protein